MNVCYILSYEEILLLSLSFLTPVSKGVSSLKNGCHLKVRILKDIVHVYAPPEKQTGPGC